MFGALSEKLEQEFKVIDRLNGFDFEEYCAFLLEMNGYQKADVTKRVGDHGADIVAERDGVRFAIQCKRQEADLGTSAIQEILAGKVFYGCHVGIALTNSGFLQHTIDYAKQLGVVLWDREYLQMFVVKALLCVHGQIYEHVLSEETVAQLLQDINIADTEGAATQQKPKVTRMSETKRIIVNTLEENGPMERDLCIKLTQDAGASPGSWERAIRLLKDEGAIDVDVEWNGRVKTATYRLSSQKPIVKEREPNVVEEPEELLDDAAKIDEQDMYEHDNLGHPWWLNQ